MATHARQTLCWLLLLLLAVPANGRPMTNSRLRNVSLSMGCPEFLSSFYTANSSAPFKSFTLTKGDGYGFVALHFTRLFVPRGTTILLVGVEDADKRDTVVNITNTFPNGRAYGNVIAPPVLAKQFRIEFYREGSLSDTNVSDFYSPDRCYGFVVDSYYYLLLNNKQSITPSTESTCAADNTKEAICYYTSSTSMAYVASRPVARLTITRSANEIAACTGWLLGSEGHLITNNHCVTGVSDAQVTTVEFLVETTDCSRSCTTYGDCVGVTAALTTTFVYTNVALDYTIVKLDTSVNLPATYGYLRLKTSAGTVGQQVFLPEYPLHGDKRISLVDDFGNRLTILNTAASGCNAVGYSYSADTQGGSSGAPVIDALDYGVVALHHCGQYCANTGVPAISIVADLQANNIVIDDATDSGDGGNSAKFPAFTLTIGATPATLTTQLVFNGALTYDSSSGVTSVDRFPFQVLADGDVAFDVLSVELSDDGGYTDLNHDCKISYADSVIFVYESDGSTLVFSVDDVEDSSVGRADGSISNRDPYARTYLKSGSYVLAITSVPADASTYSYGQINRVQSSGPELYTCDTDYQSSGAYRMTISSAGAMSISTPTAITIDPNCQPATTPICPALRHRLHHHKSADSFGLRINVTNAFGP